jgi:hypothetical protein
MKEKGRDCMAPVGKFLKTTDHVITMGLMHYMPNSNQPVAGRLLKLLYIVNRNRWIDHQNHRRMHTMSMPMPRR